MTVMTKRRMEQYIPLKREIAMLEDQIASAMDGGEYVTDVVRGSTKGPPYALHNITIQGYGSQDVPKLSTRKVWCIDECRAIEDYIASLDDSTMRQLLTRRFIEGRSAEETAELVGYSREWVSKLIGQLFVKHVT